MDGEVHVHLSLFLVERTLRVLHLESIKTTVFRGSLLWQPKERHTLAHVRNSIPTLRYADMHDVPCFMDIYVLLGLVYHCPGR